MVQKDDSCAFDLHHRDTGTPTYAGLDLSQYVSVRDAKSHAPAVVRRTLEQTDGGKRGAIGKMHVLVICLWITSRAMKQRRQMYW